MELGVSLRTFQRVIQEQKEGNGPLYPTYNTPEEEKTIINLCIEAQKNNSPISIEKLGYLMQEQAIKHKNGSIRYPSRPTIDKFLKRHKDILRKRKGVITSQNRLDVEDEKVTDWLDYMNKFLIQNHVKPCNLINIDETAIVINETKQKFVINPKIGAAKMVSVAPKFHITVISAVNAEGYAYPPFIVFAAPKKCIGTIEFTTKCRVEINPSGWVDTKMKQLFVEHLINCHEKEYKTKEDEIKVVVMDNHSSNHQDPVAELLTKHGYRGFTFPANSTHILGVFSPFKSSISKVSRSCISERNLNSEGKVDTSPLAIPELIEIIENAWKSSFLSYTIRNAWKSAGFELNNILAASKLVGSSPLPGNLLVPLEQTLALSVSPTCNQNNQLTLANEKKYGCEITSQGNRTKYRITEIKKKKGRPCKNQQQSSSVSITNNYQQNNILNQVNINNINSSPNVPNTPPIRKNRIISSSSTLIRPLTQTSMLNFIKPNLNSENNSSIDNMSIDK